MGWLAIEYRFIMTKVRAEMIHKSFEQVHNDFPMYKTYLEYKAPYYKIQIGNFITKLEAFKVQREISKKYRGSYIVPTYIQYEAFSDLSE